MALTKISTAMWNSVPHHLSHDFNVDDVLFVDVSENKVGIGTTSPTYPLDVRKNQAGYTYIASDNANAAASGTGSGFAMTESGTVAWYIRSERDGTGKFNIGNSANRITIDSTGNVGIGTNSPTSKLDVSGTIHSSVSSGYNFLADKTSGGGIGLSGSTGTTNYIVLQGSNSTNPDFEIYTGGSRRAIITSGGDVGIDTGNLTLSTQSKYLKFYHPNQTDANDGKIGAGVFDTGLNIVGAQTSAGTGRIVRIWGATVTDSYMQGTVFYDTNDTNYYIDPNSTGSSIKVRGTIENPSVWINDGDNYNDYNENIRLFNAPNGVSVIAFSASGSFGAPITSILGFSDRLETRYSNQWQTRVYNGYAQAYGSYRAPIFYDSDDTNYYLDANNTTTSLVTRGKMVNGPNTGWGKYLQIGGNGREYLNDANVASVAVTNGNLHIDAASGYDTFINYYDGNNIYFGNGSNTYNAYVNASGNMYATVYYDANDTSYYLNPNGGSVLRGTVTLHDNGSPSPLLDIRSDDAGPWAIRLYRDDLGTGPQVYAQDANSWYFNHTIIAGTSIQSNGNMYSPIFYDSNNTGYYVDPASTSNFSVIQADKIGGFVEAAHTDFYVYGNENTYYPVIIPGGAAFGFHEYSITRGYGWTAPWDPIGTGNHRGGLTFNFYWSGDTAWGGNDHNIRVKQFTEQYTTMVGGLALPVTGGVCVWLRGGGTGGALYRLRAPRGHEHNYTVYDGASQYSGHSSSTTFTAANGTSFASRTSTSNVQSEIYDARYPIRDSNTVSTSAGIYGGQFYDYNNSAYYFDGSSTGDSIRAAGDIVAYYSSDERLKNNIIKIDSALDKVNAIGGYTFEWNEISHKETGQKDIGVIAQEVEEIFPEIVQTRSNGYKAVNYEKLVPLLIEAVKELSEKVKMLENK